MSRRSKMALMVLGLISLGGCGSVHSTDGRTTTIVGFGRTTEGQTQTEFGVGPGMNSNLSIARPSSFGDRSEAVQSVFGTADEFVATEEGGK